MENPNQSNNSKKKDDFVVNKRGQVRPTNYRCKYKRLEAELVLENQIQFDENAETVEKQEENEVHETKQMDQDDIEVAEFQDEIAIQPAEKDHDAKENLIDYVKEKEETTIDDLLQILESENKWINEDDDDDEIEDHEEELSDQHEDDVINEDEPIQPGHFLTVKTSVLLIWLFVVTGSLTSQQISNVLSLINLHMMDGYPALKSLHRFKRYFKNMKSPLVKHFYCSFCLSPVSDNQVVCENQMCGKNLTGLESKEFFIELPIISQLAALFARDEFRNGLKYRKERIKINERNIEDIYDSENYKRLSQNGGPLSLENENNISFIFNTDGIPIFKSSKMSLWPIFLMINELPYRLRKYRENMIMCGLWFGQHKPDMNMFCNPFHKSLIELEKGVDIVVDNTSGEKVKVHGYLYSISCDIPARSIVLNMNQHNGESCCPKCLQTGINYRTKTGGNIRTFPYQTEESKGPTRNPDQVLADSQQALLKKSHVNGIKGPSFLMFCPQFDPVHSISIDIMHLLYLGLMRLMMKLWFNVSNSLQDFSLYQYIDIVDARLTNFRPSHFITRMPRSISDHLKFWKAAELRSWFFYYSVPCIADLMKPMYLYHYCALLEGIFLLNQTSISEEDLARSEKLLNYFVFMFPSLYDEKCLTINMHSLLHLPDIVRSIGPLWSTSCFAFESANGELLKLFHGTQYIDIQITNAVHIFQLLPSLSQSIPEKSEARELVNLLVKKQLNRDSSAFRLYGKGYNKRIGDDMMRSICEILHRPVDNLLFYKRAILRGIMYHSTDYTRSKKRNSHTVKFRNKQYGISFGYICWFVQESNDDYGDQKIMLACISLLKEKSVNIFDNSCRGIRPDEYVRDNFMNLNMRYMHFVEETEKKCLVSIENILDLCLCLKVKDGLNVVCEEPNHHEINL